MSSLYNLEPQPTASCILHTTSGDISLELWAQQIPLASRNFLQLCLDGYYDNTIFHRLVPGFILQGGDPTGTGSGGESIYDGGAYGEPVEENGVWPMELRKGKNAGPYGVGFKDEFHSRIKFNRRGLLGMANEGPDSNGSQFFLTLGDTPELQGKNTLFGRVVGDTIYNLAKMGEAEVEGDRPLYPVKITSVEVLVNPFKDMVPRKRTAAPVEAKKAAPKPKKRKGGKQLLSFGGEEGDEEPAPVLKKAKFDTRIAVDVPEDTTPEPSATKKTEKKPEKSIKKAPAISIESSPEPEGLPPPPKPAQREPSPSPSPSVSPEPVEKVDSLLSRTNAQIAELKASMRRNIPTGPVVKEKKKSALEQMIPATSIRGRKRGGQSSSTGDQTTLDLLRAFQSKLDAAPAEKPAASKPRDASPVADRNGHDTGTDSKPENKPEPEDEEATLCDLHFIANCQSCQKWDNDPSLTSANAAAENDDDNDTSWMSHALSFAADKLGKDLSYRKKAEEELVVIDPREKARSLKEERRAEREARAGGSGSRAWDRERNERLSRESRLAGRGAR